MSVDEIGRLPLATISMILTEPKDRVVMSTGAAADYIARWQSNQKPKDMWDSGSIWT